MAAKKIITKDELAEQLAVAGRMKKGDAAQAIEIIFATIAQTLVEGEYEGVKIAGFGQFSVSERPARKGVNPSNPNEKIDIEASKAVKFKPSKTLKDLLNK